MLKSTSFALLLIGAASISTLTSTAHAREGDHARFCKGVTGAAETLDCIRKDLAFQEEQLNTHYKRLFDTLDSEQTATLAALQQKWITYKDEHCAWEKQWGEGQYLSHLYEASCLAKETEHRAGRLARALNAADEKAPSEFSDAPRWINTLTQHDEKNIFWNFTTRQSFDLNCDDIDDHLLQGLEQGNEENGTATFLALLNTTKTSAASLQKVSLPHASCQGIPTITAVDPSPEQNLSLEEGALKRKPEQKTTPNTNEESTAEDGKKQCIRHLRFSQPTCPEISLTWQPETQNYTVQFQQVQQEEKISAPAP